MTLTAADGGPFMGLIALIPRPDQPERTGSRYCRELEAVRFAHRLTRKGLPPSSIHK